jgi:hypothetical protein
MNHGSTSKVVDLLLKTLARVEADSRPDEAAMEKLKRRVFRLAAQFEAVRRCETAPARSGE